MDKDAARARRGLVQRIDRALVAGKSVHSGHIATRNAAGFVQHLRHRRKAVCRARRIGNDFMAFAQFLVIDAINNRQICPDAGAKPIRAWHRRSNACRHLLGW